MARFEGEGHKHRLGPADISPPLPAVPHGVARPAIGGILLQDVGPVPQLPVHKLSEAVGLVVVLAVRDDDDVGSAGVRQIAQSSRPDGLALFECHDASCVESLEQCVDVKCAAVARAVLYGHAAIRFDRYRTDARFVHALAIDARERAVGSRRSKANRHYGNHIVPASGPTGDGAHRRTHPSRDFRIEDQRFLHRRRSSSRSTELFS